MRKSKMRGRFKGALHHLEGISRGGQLLPRSERNAPKSTTLPFAGKRLRTEGAGRQGADAEALRVRPVVPPGKFCSQTFKSGSLVGGSEEGVKSEAVFPLCVENCVCKSGEVLCFILFIHF
jgi:hypothetical protein